MINDPNLPEKPDLLPCPFCGGEAEIHGWHVSPDYRIQCANCGASTDDYYPDNGKHGVAIAAEAWNTRAPSAPAWQGMESAPKDGTDILICALDALSRPHLTVAAWKCNTWQAGGLFFGFSIAYATAWQPLPALPEAKP